MMRKLATASQASVLLAAIAALDPTSTRGILQFPEPKRKPLWTCKKCGDKFHPHMSNSLCDNCIRARDGEPT